MYDSFFSINKIKSSVLLQVDDWVGATMEIVDPWFYFMKCKVEKFLPTLWIYLFVFQLFIVIDGAILLIDLHIFGHNGPSFAILRISQHQIKSWGSSEYSFSDKLLFLDEVSFLSIDIWL